MAMRRCTGPCGLEYPEEAFFRRNPRVANAFATRRPVCIGCETTARNDEKGRDRLLAKARDTIRRHARKWGLTAADFCEQFGWNIDQLKHDINHASKNGCPYCHRQFATMGHGLSDITIDIINPKTDPLYTTNTKIICQTCNREKGRTPPEIWAHKLICWARWEKQEELRKKNPMAGCPLWDWAFS